MTTKDTEDGCVDRFAEDARRAVYEVIALRRDVRRFRPEAPVEDEVLARVLAAAHLAPSVGFSQAWGFVVVRDRATRERIRASFLRCREAEAARFPADRRAQYLSYKLEGILEAPVNVCVAVDLRPRGEAILGTTVQPEAVRASACCAVQNLWLAARAEGLGVGWVSIVESAVLRAELALPEGVHPIAYLCVGRPVAFRDRPMLEESGWLPRRAVDDVIHRERWTPAHAHAPAPESAHAHACAPAFDAHAAGAARAHLDELTKPTGSLGRLEDLVAWFAGATGRYPNAPPDAAVAVFAADHGVVVEAVSAYGSQVTAGMVCTMMAGGAAINVLARRHGVRLVLVDVGVAGDLSGAPVVPKVPLVRTPVRAGTRNLRIEAAMTHREARAAMAAGARTANDCIDAGAGLVGAGEVGIGNTTAAAAIVCALTGARPSDVVGGGTGIDDATRARKVTVVEDALRLHALDRNDPLVVLAAVGGFELAAMVGFVLRAAERRVPVVLDGFLAAASALVAETMRPSVKRLFVASHASAERGSALVLETLDLAPLLSLDLRLGEGTGAVLGIDLVRTALALDGEMATFATAGVVRPRDA